MTLAEQLHRSATHKPGIDPNCPVCNPWPVAKRKSITDYANTHKGAALYALAQWIYWNDHGSANDDIRTGRMYAYADILLQITGRNVGTERSMVLAVINGMV